MRWSLLAIVLVAGCAASRHGADPIRDVQPGEEFSLRIGERAQLVDARPVTFVFEHVLEDSRCALNVKCVWEGRASVVIRAAASGADHAGHSSVALTLDTRGNDATFDGRLRISLVKLEPEAAHPELDYWVTLRVDPVR